MTAIAALFIAGCGGGGGGGGGAAATLPVGGALVAGAFQNATVEILDKNNNVYRGTTNASGVYSISIPATALGPFVVRGGKAGEQFFDEGSGASAVVAASSVSGDGFALHAVVQNTATLTAASSVISPVTERMAAAIGLTASGVLPASAIPMLKTKIDAYTARYGFNPVTVVPTLVTTAAALAALPANPGTDAHKYAQLLAVEAKQAGTGHNALTVARELADAVRENRPISSALVTLPVGASDDPDEVAFLAASAQGVTLPAATITAAALKNWIEAAETMASAISGKSETIEDAAEEALHHAFSQNPSILPASAAAEAQTVAEIIEALSPALLADASAAQAAIAAAVQAAASGLSPASAAAEATTQATIAVPIAAAKTLLTSLRTNGNLLTNTGKTGFIDTQFAAVQTDFNSISGSFAGLRDTVDYGGSGLDLLRTGASVGTLYTGWNGSKPPCKVTAANTAVCQWVTSDPIGWATHQLTLTKTGATTYIWSESLIAAGTVSLGQFLPALGGMTLAVGGSGAPGTPISGNTAQTGTITAVYGTNSWTSLNLSGNIQPPYAPTDAHHHTAIATNGSVSTSGGNNTYTLTGSVAEVNSASVPVLTLSLNTGTSLVGNSTTGAPVSAKLVLQGKTVNYQFDGTLDSSNPAQDLGGIYYLRTNSFTGSVSHRTNSAVGSFMTGTLSLTLDDSHLNQSLPLVPGGNYSGLTSTFSGSITNRTITPAMVYQVTAHSSQPWTTSVTTGDLTYTDPGNNTVTVTWNDTPPGPGIPATVGTVTMGSIKIENGSIYSGTTLIGTVSGPTVYFNDGTFITMQ